MGNRYEVRKQKDGKGFQIFDRSTYKIVDKDLDRWEADEFSNELEEQHERSVRRLVVSDCAQLSSGTIATLTGYSSYEMIDATQNDFTAWVEENQSQITMTTWVEAWEAYRETVPQFDTSMERSS
jgi:hypothetical protein